MTKKENFVAIENILRETGNAELADVMAHEVELLAKKSSKNTKAKAETAVRAERAYNALAKMDKPVTITELKQFTDDEEVANWNTQRIVALFKFLGDRVQGEMVKGKKYFTVA